MGVSMSLLHREQCAVEGSRDTEVNNTGSFNNTLRTSEYLSQQEPQRPLAYPALPVGGRLRSERRERGKADQGRERQSIKPLASHGWLPGSSHHTQRCALASLTQKDGDTERWWHRSRCPTSRWICRQDCAPGDAKERV